MNKNTKPVLPPMMVLTTAVPMTAASPGFDTDVYLKKISIFASFRQKYLSAHFSGSGTFVHMYVPFGKHEFEYQIPSFSFTNETLGYIELPTITI
jgi:hypothetical protein